MVKLATGFPLKRDGRSNKNQLSNKKVGHQFVGQIGIDRVTDQIGYPLFGQKRIIDKEVARTRLVVSSQNVISAVGHDVRFARALDHLRPAQ